MRLFILFNSVFHACALKNSYVYFGSAQATAVFCPVVFDSRFDRFESQPAINVRKACARWPPRAFAAHTTVAILLRIPPHRAGSESSCIWNSDVTWQRSLLPFSDCSAPILREGLLLSSNQALLELPTPCALCSPKSGRCDHRGPSSIQFGEYLGRESAPGRQGGPQCHERPSKSPPFWGCGGGCALMRALVDCTRGHVFRAWVYYASLHLYRD